MSDYFDRIERQLVARVQTGAAREAGRRSRLTGPLVPALAVAVVVAIVAVVLTFGRPASAPVTTPPAAGGSPSTTLAFTAAPGASAESLRATVATLRARLSTVSSHLTVTRRGDSIVVAGVSAGDRTSVLALATPGKLAFLDWEGDVLLPDGRTVASALPSGASDAIRIGQGSGSAPGAADAGGMTLYSAVRLAARQPAGHGGGSASLYLFGRRGRSASAAAAQAASRGSHCLLAGPAPSGRALAAQLPSGVTLAQGQHVTVRPGTTVLQAASAVPGRSLAPGNPTCSSPSPAPARVRSRRSRVGSRIEGRP